MRGRAEGSCREMLGKREVVTDQSLALGYSQAAEGKREGTKRGNEERQV